MALRMHSKWNNLFNKGKPVAAYSSPGVSKESAAGKDGSSKPERVE